MYQLVVLGLYVEDLDLTLDNDGVSLATIRKRLGHKNIQTTLRYAEQSDETADAELRAWRRKKEGLSR